MCVIYYSQIGGNRRYIVIDRSDLQFISNRKTRNISNCSRNDHNAIGSQRSFAAVYPHIQLKAFLGPALALQRQYRRAPPFHRLPQAKRHMSASFGGYASRGAARAKAPTAFFVPSPCRAWRPQSPHARSCQWCQRFKARCGELKDKA